jgi:hypothetical protein
MNSEVIHVHKQIGVKEYGGIRVYLHSFINLGCRRWLIGQLHLRILDLYLYILNISRPVCLVRQSLQPCPHPAASCKVT